MPETQTTLDTPSDASLALQALAPIITLLDAANEAEDGEDYQALVGAARQSAHAMAAILRR